MVGWVCLARPGGPGRRVSWQARRELMHRAWLAGVALVALAFVSEAQVTGQSSSKKEIPLAQDSFTKGGAAQSPVYANLQKQSGKLPGWNFAKYLVSKDGKVVRFYESGVKPDDAGLRKDIETALR
jgi:hypothetical protein